MNPIIGIDFDNTIVCYEDIFHKVAVEKGLIPAKTSRSKEAVRNYLRGIGNEDAWTELQGYVYGARMGDVLPFPGVLEFIKKLVKQGIQVYIISHKTRYPYLGELYDLHGSAREWLFQYGLFDKGRIGMNERDAFFEETKEAKLQRISERGCTHFIDDLPEFLLENGFPDITERLLFAPNIPEGTATHNGIRAFRSWGDISAYFGIA